MKRPSLKILIALSGAMLVAAACRIESPFVRENPFDSKGNAKISIVGPDSMHAMWEVAQYSVVLEAPYDSENLNVNWVSPVPPILIASPDGQFLSRSPVSEYRRLRIEARFDDNIIAKVINVGQRIGGFELSCSRTVLIKDCPGVISPELARLYGHMEDIAGYPVSNTTGAFRRADVTTRNGSLVWETVPRDSTGGLTFHVAPGEGSAWVVVTIDGQTDSILVNVAAPPTESSTQEFR